MDYQEALREFKLVFPEKIHRNERNNGNHMAKTSIKRDSSGKIIDNMDRPTDCYNYSPIKGIYPSNINMYTEHIHNRAKVFFSILDEYDLEYAVFAGQSVGAVRNNKNIPWVDDYDMIIMKDQIDMFEQTIIPILLANNFSNRIINLHGKKGGYYFRNISPKQNKAFTIDIFYSYFDENDILRNFANWGMYSKKNIHKSYVVPFERRQFHDDMYLPFFKNIDKEVELCYGNVHDNCVVSTHSFLAKKRLERWEPAYQKFNLIKEFAINTTKNSISANVSNNTGSKKMVVVDNQFNNEIDLLKHIAKNNIKNIYIFNKNFLELFSATIKYYFPEITITYFCYDRHPSTSEYFDYIDLINVPDTQTINYYQNPKFFCNKMPTIKIIKLMIISSFDNSNIQFDKLSQYSKNIIVGLITSSDTDPTKRAEMLETMKNNISTQPVQVSAVVDVTGIGAVQKYVSECSVNLLIVDCDGMPKNIQSDVLTQSDDQIQSDAPTQSDASIQSNALNQSDCPIIFLKNIPNKSTQHIHITKQNKNIPVIDSNKRVAKKTINRAPQKKKIIINFQQFLNANKKKN
jgi:phosphorylcholine metabolism protein LicD